MLYLEAFSHAEFTDTGERIEERSQKSCELPHKSSVVCGSHWRFSVFFFCMLASSRCASRGWYSTKLSITYRSQSRLLSDSLDNSQLSVTRSQLHLDSYTTRLYTELVGPCF